MEFITWKSGKLWTQPVQALDVLEQKLEINCNKNLGLTINLFSNATDFFQSVLTEKLLDHIYYQTQFYNTWQNISRESKKVKGISREEIQQFIGIIFVMGAVKLPTRCMYWQTAMRVDLVADNMNLNRFAKTLWVMHFNDNSQIPTDNYNSSYKIQPLDDTQNNTFRSIVPIKTYLTVDEQMAPFKGKSHLHRYMSKKPKKWSYKLWALAGISGFVY